MVVFSAFLMKAQEKQHKLSQKKKRKDFTPKKDDESKECKEKILGEIYSKVCRK